MTIDEVNKALRNYGKPAAKAPTAANKKIDTALLKARIAEARKNVGAIFAPAQMLGAHEIADKTRKLSQSPKL